MTLLNFGANADLLSPYLQIDGSKGSKTTAMNKEFERVDTVYTTKRRINIIGDSWEI